MISAGATLFWAASTYPERSKLCHAAGWNRSGRNAMAGLLDGKSALITGGGGGIGRATALAFAREGARLAVADLMEEAARETVALVNAAGGQAISLAGDVTQDSDVRSMTEAVIST
jgi:NADP-dependent 3-hydroxy acid dehydrogenase YdfG